MRLGSFLRQCQAVTRYNLETIWERRAVSVVAIFGIAGVVGVMVAVLSMAAGFRAVVTGRPATTWRWCCGAAPPAPRTAS